MKIENFESYLETQMANLTREIEKLKVTLFANYLNRFHWDADILYELMWEHSTLASMWVVIDNGGTPANALQYGIDNAKRHLFNGGFVPNSTSALANMENIYKAKVASDFLSMVQYWSCVKDGTVKF